MDVLLTTVYQPTTKKSFFSKPAEYSCFELLKESSQSNPLTCLLCLTFRQTHPTDSLNLALLDTKNLLMFRASSLIGKANHWKRVLGNWILSRDPTRTPFYFRIFLPFAKINLYRHKSFRISDLFLKQSIIFKVR